MRTKYIGGALISNLHPRHSPLLPFSLTAPPSAIIMQRNQGKRVQWGKHRGTTHGAKLSHLVRAFNPVDARDVRDPKRLSIHLGTRISCDGLNPAFLLPPRSPITSGQPPFSSSCDGLSLGLGVAGADGYAHALCYRGAESSALLSLECEGSGRARGRGKGDKSSRLMSSHRAASPVRSLLVLRSIENGAPFRERRSMGGVEKGRRTDRQMMRGTWICVSRVDISGDV